MQEHKANYYNEQIKKPAEDHHLAKHHNAVFGPGVSGRILDLDQTRARHNVRQSLEVSFGTSVVSMESLVKLQRKKQFQIYR